MKTVLLIALLILAYLFPQSDSHRASLKPVAVKGIAQQAKLDHLETSDRAGLDNEKPEKAKMRKQR
ncbi:MAG: hypothetical protein ACREQW_23495 [Candidatus Binatia bacterium]